MIAVAGALLGLALVVASAPPTKDERLAELRQLRQDDACERLIAMAHWVEDHRLATHAERQEAMFARGQCLVALGNISEASGVFVEIILEDEAANPPFAVEPRVQVLIEAARAEVQRRRAAAKAAALAALLAKINVDVREPAALSGGNRATFFVDVVDPESAIRSMRIDFKKESEPEFYALPIVRQPDGAWRGEIPGTYTRSRVGSVLLWYITASDERGDTLLSIGTRDTPRRTEIAPGSLSALDLKANERLPPFARGSAAVVVTPMFAGAGLGAGMLLAGLPLLTQQYFLDFEAAEQTSSILFTFLPGVGAVAMTSVVAWTLLDPGMAVWVTVLASVTAAVGEAGVIILLIDNDGSVVPRAPNGNGQPNQGGTGAGPVVAALGVGATLTLPAVLTLALVIADAPTE